MKRKIINERLKEIKEGKVLSSDEMLKRLKNKEEKE